MNVATDPGESWKDDGVCKEVNVEWFFVEDAEQTLIPKMKCNDCPVRNECLSYSLVRGIRFGIWGGMTAKERWALSRHTHGSARMSLKCNCSPCRDTKTVVKRELASVS